MSSATEGKVGAKRISGARVIGRIEECLQNSWISNWPLYGQHYFSETKAELFLVQFFFFFFWCQKIRVSVHPCQPFSCRELSKSGRKKSYHLCSQTQMLFMLLQCFTAVYLGVL